MYVCMYVCIFAHKQTNSLNYLPLKAATAFGRPVVALVPLPAECVRWFTFFSAPANMSCLCAVTATWIYTIHIDIDIRDASTNISKIGQFLLVKAVKHMTTWQDR